MGFLDTHMVMVSLLLLSSLSLATVTGHIVPRDYPISTTQSYDYVVVGCGIAGLAVAARLSEDPNNSVVCIETGTLDDHEPAVEYPVYVGYRPPQYEWDVETVPQTQLDGKTRQVVLGKGIGGGSLINGLLWNRGGRIDFDGWARLGNPGWDWAGLLPYFKKSESYSPWYYRGLQRQPVTDNATMHGTAGPVNVSYPGYFWPQTNEWFNALASLDIPTCHDPNDGTCAGSYFIPSSINADTQTRSDARVAYHDAAADRLNYHVVTSTRVSRVIFDTTDPAGDQSLRATGVEVVGSDASMTFMVNAAKEVILAAGAIHTPQLLELSGIGNSSLLSSLDIPVLQDLPGVGNNLQDHPMIHLDYPFQNTSVPTPTQLLSGNSFDSLARLAYLSSHTGPWTSKPSTAVAFLSLEQAAVNDTGHIFSLLEQAANASTNDDCLPEEYHCRSTNNQSVLCEAYAYQRNLTINALFYSNTPAYEILNDNAGGLDLALMHPFSRGTVHITTTDIFDEPAVHPNWLAHPIDMEVLIRALHFNQRILTTPFYDSLQPAFWSPDGPGTIPLNISRSAAIALLKAGVGTEFHYCGTAAMLPRELGGVVDNSLHVHGTANLRVVDTSVFPIVPGAHLQSVAYAVAEKAADLIKADN